MVSYCSARGARFVGEAAESLKRDEDTGVHDGDRRAGESSVRNAVLYDGERFAEAAVLPVQVGAQEFFGRFGH